MEVLATPFSDKVKEARDILDVHVRDMVAWHFDPNTGCPFWLEFAGELDFDPRREIGGYSDLKYLGHFQDEWLRGDPCGDGSPGGVKNSGTYVFETGGSTVCAQNRISQNDFQIDYEMFSEHLSEETFPKGADWLMLGPTGPRRCAWLLNIFVRFAVEFVFSWISIRDGSTS